MRFVSLFVQFLFFLQVRLKVIIGTFGIILHFGLELEQVDFLLVEFGIDLFVGLAEVFDLVNDEKVFGYFFFIVADLDHV